MVNNDIDDIINKVTAPKATSSNTIYFSEINLNLVCDALSDYHGKQLSEAALSELLYDSWNQKRRPCTRKSFMTTYRVVFHSWSLYYIENGRFFFTNKIQEYISKKCSYAEVLQTLCAKWQYPKPQQMYQPKGPIRPMVSLLTVMQKLRESGLSNGLSYGECNLFLMFMDKDSDLEDFLQLLIYYRKNKDDLTDKLQQRSLEIKTDNYESGIDRIVWYLRKANAIVKNKDKIEVA